MRLVKRPYKRLSAHRHIHSDSCSLCKRSLYNTRTPHIYQCEVVYLFIFVYLLRHCLRIAAVPQLVCDPCHKPQVLIVYINLFSQRTAKRSPNKVCNRTLYPVLPVKKSYKLTVCHILQRIAFQCRNNLHRILHLDIVTEIVISVNIGYA